MTYTAIRYPYFTLKEFSGVDPEFDEEESDCALLMHEIDSCGAVPSHPDGDRLSPDFDPVPLHTRVYNDGTVAELKIREWKQHLEDLKRWRIERAENEARWQAEYAKRREGTETRTVERSPEERAEGEAFAFRFASTPRPPPLSPQDELLANMKLGTPVLPGQGRVYNDHVMVNESDLAKWAADRTRRSLKEVWRGQGYVIFRLRY